MFTNLIKPLLMVLGLTTFLSSYSQINTVTLDATQDAYVLSVTPSTNYGTATNMSVGVFPFFSSSAISRAFLKFDIAGFITANSIPANAVITEAKLSLGIFSETSVTNSSFSVRRAVTSWTETGVTYSSQPSTTTLGTVGTSTKSTVGSYSHRHFNVTTHVSEMVKGFYTNEGWCISLTNESTATNEGGGFYARENTDPTVPDIYDPQLTISYYIPTTVTAANITHASSLTATDGSIVPTFAGGSGSPTYKWYKNGTLIAPTTASISGQGYGWYGVEVTGTLGDKFYMAFILGAKCTSASISFKPGPNFIDDVLINNPPLGSQSVSGGSVTTQGAYSAVNFGGWLYGNAKTLMKFRLWVPNDLNITQANLSLFGSAHSGTANAAVLSRNTANFDEYPSYYLSYTMPSTTATGAVSLAHRGSATADITGLNLKPFWDLWKANNTQNYGMTLSSATVSGTNNQAQVYHSSDASDPAKTPVIDFVFDLMYTSSPCYCNQAYAKLEKTLSGVNYPVCVDKLEFYYQEEYTASTALTYTVRDNNNLVVMSNATFPLVKKYDYNAYDLYVTSLSAGTYILEVTNNKNEKFYLRFSK